jgi:AsmA-like C-terminal region
MSRVSKDSEYTPWKSPPLKKWRKLFKVLVIGCVLLFAGAVGSLMFLDMDTLRKSLAKSLSEKTGTQVEIQFLNLEYSRGLGLEAGGLTVRSGDRDQQLLWAESLFLEVKVMPLLTGEVVVESASIIKPRIKVYRDSKDPLKTKFTKTSLSSQKKRTVGDYSMAEVITPETPAPTEQDTPQETSSALIDRRIIDEFRNRLKKFHITAENIHVEEGALRIIASGEDGPKESESIGFSFDMKVRRPSAEVIDVILEDLHLSQGSLSLLGRVEADDVLSKTSRLEVQIRTKPFAISELIQAFAPPSKEQGEASGDSNIPVQIEQLTLLASCPLNSLTDTKTLRRDLKAEARFVTRDAQIPIGEYEALVSQIKGTAKWEGSYILYEIHGETLRGKARIDGQQPFPFRTTEDPNPLLETEIHLTAIDFSRLIIPKGWEQSKGLVSGVLKVALPWNMKDPPLVTGSLLGENLVLAGESIKLSSQKTEVQFETSPDKSITMDLVSNQVEMDDIRFKKITAQVFLIADQVVLKRSTFMPRHGTLTAHGTYNTQSQKYKLDFLGKDLRAGDYTKNEVRGILRTHGSINGHVPEKLPGIRGLFGKVSLKVSPVNFDKSEEVKTILAVIDPTFFRKQNIRGLRFDYLGGNFNINNGKFHTSNLTLKGKPMDVYFEGLFDGHSQSLNMMGKAVPKFNTTKALSASPQLARLLSKAQAKGGVIKTHFKLEGPASHPQMTLIGIKPQKHKTKQLLKGLKDLKKK